MPAEKLFYTNNNIKMNKILTPVILCFSAFIITSCGGDKKLAPMEQPVINDSIVKNVKTAPATLTGDSNYVKLNGKIQADETKTAKVYAMVSGKIQTVNVELGDYVQKGKTLAILKSTDVAGVTNDLSLAQSDVDMAKKSLQTTEDLYKGKLATEQDYINAKITYNKALSELNRSKQVAAITGGKNATLTVTSPISGFVIEKNITNKSEVRQDNNANLFTVADLSDVWITANVYESDIMNIHLGDPVIVNTLANPDVDYPGKIDKIYNVLDPATRTMQVRITLPNTRKELKPEMFATVKVNVQTTGKIMSIPSTALVMDNSKYYVIIKQNGKLHIQEITLIKRNEGKAYIKGLNEGDQVVTQSQVFIYQALSSN